LKKSLYPASIIKEIRQPVVEFLKQQKNTDKIDVAVVEEQDDG
jgi:hypothetical protein